MEIKQKKKKTSGIYKITNTITGKIYVGQSSTLDSRWWKHQWFLNNGSHHNRHLQASWNKYGAEAFTFEIIEECAPNLLDEKEAYWINYYDSYYHGYNLDFGGQGIRGYKHTEEEIQKMRRIQAPAIVLQFDLEFNLIKRWDGGATHIHKVLGFTSQSISLRCRHLIHPTMTPYKYCYWVYEDEYRSKNFTWDNYLKNIPATSIGDICKLKTKENIIQYDENRNFIKLWSDLGELLDQGYDVDRIRLICNHTGKLKTYKNYIWAYESYDFSDGYFDVLHKPKKNHLLECAKLIKLIVTVI